jgi:hypothetical protein
MEHRDRWVDMTHFMQRIYNKEKTACATILIYQNFSMSTEFLWQKGTSYMLQSENWVVNTPCHCFLNCQKQYIMYICLRKHTHNLQSHMCKWGMQHNTCFHGEQDGGHSWCNGLAVPDSWHSLVHMVHMYSGHNLKLYFSFYLKDNFINSGISAC